MIPTLQEIKIQFSKRLQALYSPQEALQLSRLLLEASLHLNTAQLLSRLHETPDKDAWNLLQKRITDLEHGVPIQYILGETTFLGLPFRVNSHTLIPRPETEELVQNILDEISKENKTEQPLNILDIGTGSGCIAVSLALHLPQAHVYALDISEAALDLARANAKLNEVNVRFQAANMLQWEDCLPSELAEVSEKGWDIIVSNPPYIPQSEQAGMHTNVLAHEPHLALFVEDSDPLIFYRSIRDFANRYLKDEGQLWFEIHEKLTQEYLSLFEAEETATAQIIRDLNNRDRMLWVRKKKRAPSGTLFL